MAGGAARTGPGWVQSLGPATTTVLLRHGETALSGGRRITGRGDIPLTGTGLGAGGSGGGTAGRTRRPRGDHHLTTGPGPADRRVRPPRRDRPARAGGGGLGRDRFRGMGRAQLRGGGAALAGGRWPPGSTSAGAAPPGGESLAAASERVLAALDSLLAAHAGTTVLVVSHVTPMKILLSARVARPACGAAAHAAGCRLSVRDRLVRRGSRGGAHPERHGASFPAGKGLRAPMLEAAAGEQTGRPRRDETR